MTEESTTGTNRRKRCVLLHRSGLHRIIGVLDLSIHEPRPLIELDIEGEHIVASLLAVKARRVIYRQTIADTAIGRLGEFHPDQQ